jgi:hypothetical protein
MREAPLPTLAADEFDRLPALSQIQNDRFCESCGYNLRLQAVRRDPHLELLVVHCPECGRYTPVAVGSPAWRVWFQRFSGLLVLAWVAALVVGLILLAMAQGAIMIEMVETVGRLWRVAPGSTTFPQGRGVTNPNYREFMALMTALLLGVGFAGVGLTTIVLPHWRRWGFLLLALALPPAVAGCVFLTAPDRYQRWIGPYMAWSAGVLMIGGLLGRMAGRPLARLLVRMFVPPTWRAYVSFLWTVDGKMLER